jgi:hypothetical protein
MTAAMMLRCGNPSPRLCFVHWLLVIVGDEMM